MKEVWVQTRARSLIRHEGRPDGRLEREEPGSLSATRYEMFPYD